MRPDRGDPRQAGVWAYLPEEPLAGRPGSPLSGLSFSVKDLFGVEGWPLRASTRAPLPQVPEGPLVRRLLDLGATLLGKTQLHEIALGITGANPFGGTPHPQDAARVSGGSSSGAAASAALNLSDFALGTDTGGSIRVPAAWCGVFGYKPTKHEALWPTDGVLALSPTCDHAGPLARDLSTVVQVQEALSGQPVPPANWQGLRVGVWNPDGWLDTQARRALLDTVEAAERLGAEVCSPFSLPDMLDAYSDIVQSEAAAVHREALALDDPGFGAGTLALLRRGAALTPEQVAAAHERRDEHRRTLEIQSQGLDVLLAPAVPTAAPLISQDSVELDGAAVPLRVAVLRLTAPFSLLGWPVLVLPCAAEAGLSVGVQLVARPGDDARLLGLAQTLDRERRLSALK